MAVDRLHWQQHVESVVRSRHYTWLAEGLGGEPTELAMRCLLADIMHVCQQSGIHWDTLLDEAREQYHCENDQPVLAH